jgi:hypothetical protein
MRAGAQKFSLLFFFRVSFYLFFFRLSLSFGTVPEYLFFLSLPFVGMRPLARERDLH